MIAAAPLTVTAEMAERANVLGYDAAGWSFERMDRLAHLVHRFAPSVQDDFLAGIAEGVSDRAY
jgi:hypothetical protein